MVIGIPRMQEINFFKMYIFIIIVFFSNSFFAVQHCDAENTTNAAAIFLDGKGRELCLFSVELAVTQEEQSRGLMFRKDLPSGSGMLFVNNDDEMRSFWMKNTYIPLDIIFINSQYEVKHVHYGAKVLDETPITSRYPARYILEVNASKAKKCKIVPGTKVQFRF